MRYLVDCLAYSSKFLDEIGVRYWLDCASLLGFYRDNRIIPWDKDVDFSIMSSDAPRILEHYQKIIDDEYYPMYRLHKETYPKNDFPFKGGKIEVVKFFVSQKNRLHADMYCHDECDGKISRLNPNWPCNSFSSDFVKDLKTVDFHGVKVYIPRETKAYLTLLYGEDFMEYPSHRIQDMKRFEQIKDVYASRNL